MTIKDCIDIVDSNKPNQYTITDKVRWLSFIDEKIINDVLKTHEGYDGRYDDFTGYSDDKLSVTLIAPSPYDRLYTQYLKMKIDEENGETARYNNSATLFNSYYLEYKKYYNKLHKPLSNSSSECNSNIKTNCKAVTDAELESLKNELSFILKNYFADTISDDKVNDVVTKYMQNNTELFKGKDGKTPVKGFDYFTPEEVKEFQKILDDNFNDLKESELGKKENLITPNNENIVEAINGIFSEVIQLGSFVPSALDGKVDKVEGKGLSEVNYTANDKTLLYRINNQIKALDQNMAYKVDAVPGKTLSSNDYTSEDKALLYETKTQMSGKVDKEFGKGLSTEDYTTEEKEKLSNLDNRVKDIEEKEHITEHLTNFFKDRPQGLYVDDLDNLTYENTGGGVFLWGKPQDGAKQNDIVFVTQGFSPRRREFLVTFQMKISLTALAYAEFDSYNIKQRYQTFSHPTVQEPDGWSEWEDIYTTFKKVPYGKSIDDLYDEKYFGWYMNDVKSKWSGDAPLGQQFEILFVNDGYYRDETIGDLGCYSQIRFVWNGHDFNIQTRYHNFKKWSDWQDVFATPKYVKEQIAKIPTGGGGEQAPTYLTEYFKILPENADIDALVEEGKYIVNKRIDVADYIETITVRRGVNNYEDFDSEYQTIYQVKECFDSNGYQMLIRDRVSDYQWSEWQDCFGTDGSDDKLFTYEPQLEITAEEAVNTITINEINGISLADYNYTALKCVVENAVLETKGPNAQVTVYVNSKAYDKYQVPMGSPTTFINADKKLYWGCYADIKSGLMLSANSSVSNETWSSLMYMPINSQNLHRKDKIEYLNISIVMHETFPIGTKFRLWFK